MTDLIIQSLVFVSLAAGSLALFGKQFGDNFLRDVEKEKLRQKFENWWLTVEVLPAKQLICRIIKKLGEAIDAYLGQKLLSKKSFRRCGIISLSLLSCTLLILSLFIKDHGLVTPWKNYHDSLQILKSAHQKESHNEKDIKLQELDNKIYKAALRLDTVPYAIIFSAIYYAVIFLTSGLGFFLTTVFLRKSLRVLAETSDLFVVISLFVFTTLLTSVVTTVCIFIIGVVKDPALWLLTLLGAFFALLSVRMAFLMTFTAGAITWFFASPATQVLAAVIFSPLVLAVIIVGFTFSVLLKPRLFHWVVARILLLCAEKEPITIIATLLAAVSSILAFGIGKIR